MKKLTLSLAAVVLPLFALLALRGSVEAQPAATPVAAGDPVALERQAEKLYAEGSYALAHEVYERLAALELPPEVARWVEFRLADTTWRAQAATAGPDDTLLEQGRESLERLIRDVRRDEDRDRLWAEVQESLGDFWWNRRQSRNWGQAWNHYQAALDWWAGSREIDAARARYLAIVFRIARPEGVEPYYYYGYYGNQLPLPIVENALEIARSDEHRAHAQYLLAMTLRSQSVDPARHRRTVAAFEGAIAAGRATAWHDDALFWYAEWLQSAGRLERQAGGGFVQRPDYVRALELYRRLRQDYVKGETRYHDQAKQRIEAITRPSLGVAVGNFYLPESEVRFHLHWRNVSRVDLALYPVDLTRDVRLGDRQGDWLASIDLAGGKTERTWTRDTADTGEHLPGQGEVVLDRKLPVGAYVLEARAGGERARELVLVTRGSLVLKTAGSRALVFVCDALTGAPRPSARLTLHEHAHRDGKWRWRSQTGSTDGQGLAVFDVAGDAGNANLFVAAADGEHQTFAQGWSHGYRPDGGESWKIYAFTDRPAYRPGDEVRWKVVARRYDGAAYRTPAGGTLTYEISDPRGATFDSGELELNRFGGAWSAVTPGEELPLGEYRVTFKDAATDDVVGGAVLFRLEEYKLPEFTVSVRTPERDGRPVAFKTGESVEAEIRAEYYFGGPVAGAQVELLVYQKPLWIRWEPQREHPWLYRDMVPRFWDHGPGQVLRRETLTTDAEGRARVSFETPAGAGQDMEYTVEARVTDSSRREITGRGSVRVGRQLHYVFPRAEHSLYRPGDRVEIELKAIDANDNPVEVEGRVTVTRDRWVEIWVDPSGREVTGRALEKLRRTRPAEPGWQVRSQGYEREEVLSRRVRTGPDGTAELDFTPAAEGYYRVAWSSEDRDGDPVAAETTVWVADRDSTRIGYHPGGVQIIVDKDTARAGRPLPVMLTAPAGDAWVLFTVEADDLYDWQVVHLTGTVKLVELLIDARHVPNVYLEAALVTDGELLVDTEQVVVPPDEHFLDVEVALDREEYLPRQQGRLTVTTRDHEGRPVAAEVALSLVDDSVFYIQQDYAPDPREFFFGDKRAKRTRIQGSFHHKAFVRLGRDAEGGLVDRRGDDLDPSMMPGVAAAKSRFAADAVAEEAFVGNLEAKRAAQAPAAAPAPAEIAGGATGEPAVEVRTDFRATAFWQPDVVTGEDGRATIEVDFPDSLTTWRARARVATAGSAFGTAQATARTNKPLMARLQAPRFFVAGDTAIVSAVINNRSESDLVVVPTLEAEGLRLVGRVDPAGQRGPAVALPAGGEVRVDWSVEAQSAGEARLTVTARADQHDDAMMRSYRVWEHGIDKLLARSGKLRGSEAEVSIELPAARRAGSTTLTVQIAPSLAVTLLDSLPYLIDYPYGCTEQTMSRFLPAVVVSGTLERLGLRPEDVAGRMFGGIERGHAAATHPDGPRDLAKLHDMVRQGLRRLSDFQHGDGGWGWWKEGDSDHFMSAYVVWGLALAREAGVKVDDSVLRRGIEFLDRELVEQEREPDLQAFMLHALTAARPGGSRFQRTALDNLYGQRDRLNAYTRALVALSAHRLGEGERALTLTRNLRNGVDRDDAPDTSVIQRGIRGGGTEVMGTAHWGEDGLVWRWSEGGVEATAFALTALLTVEPESDLIEPVVNWLVKNRRGAQWNSTRDTAIVVLALTGYLERSGELDAQLAYEVTVNGREVARQRVEPADVLRAPSRFTVDPGLLRDGRNQIRIRRTAEDGALYFAVETRFFSLEEPVTPAGNELFVRRSYFRRVPQPTLLKGPVWDNRSLGDGGTVTSGERVEVVLTLESKNHLEYLVFEDLKPAGLEAVEVRSGGALFARELKRGAHERDPAAREEQDYTGRTRWVHRELRDRKLALFVDKLPEGVWEIRYELRAETPGRFHALPLLGQAMYVPEIRANGAELRLLVDEPGR